MVDDGEVQRPREGKRREETWSRGISPRHVARRGQGCDGEGTRMKASQANDDEVDE